MIRDTIKFAVKLFFVNLAVSFLGIITLSLLLSAQVGFAICAVAGFIFIGFTLGVVWDNTTRKGGEDCKATLNFLKYGSGQRAQDSKRFYPAKGFIAGLIAMLPYLIIWIIYMCGTFHGWEKGVPLGVQLLYSVLYLSFIPYAPFLRLATVADPIVYPTHYMPLGSEATQYFNLMTVNSNVMPYMFIIPIVLYILTAGICYILGNKQQQKLYPEHTFKKYFEHQENAQSESGSVQADANQSAQAQTSEQAARVGDSVPDGDETQGAEGAAIEEMPQSAESILPEEKEAPKNQAQGAVNGGAGEGE